MPKPSESSVGNAVEGQPEGFEEREERTPTPERVERPAHPSGGPFHILKPGQGTKVRWGSAIGAGALAVAGAQFIWEQIQVVNFGTYDVMFRTLIPVLLLVAAIYGIFVAVGRNERIIEFMTATEGEMKKVNWSSRREVWGATKVVIVTVLALGMVLAVVDLVFIVFFSLIGVLRMNLLGKLFGGGGVA
jgi:preprotein translocase SecE subunit